MLSEMQKKLERRRRLADGDAVSVRHADVVDVGMRSVAGSIKSSKVHMLIMMERVVVCV